MLTLRFLSGDYVQGMCFSDDGVGVGVGVG